MGPMTAWCQGLVAKIVFLLHIFLNINIKCNANEEQFNKIKDQLKMFCPISKVIANSGTIITENWNKV